MHVALTDVLTCPRCGPEFGLVLLADEVVDRRVLEGSLGCANCRERYTVTGGFADLRFPPDPSATAQSSGRDINALEIAAALGVTEGPALLMLVGATIQVAFAVTQIISGIEVVAVSAGPDSTVEQPGVSRVGAFDKLPFRSGCMNGVALLGTPTSEAIDEASRTVRARARLAVFNADESVAARLEGHGLRVMASDQTATVAQRALI